MGDILLSASKTGNVKVGRVEKIHDSGYITVKFAEKRNRYAYEDGAPDIAYQSRRTKRDDDGNAIMEDDPRGIRDYRGKVWQRVVTEEYTAYRKDYTVVGTYWAWKQEEAAHYARFVVRSTADHPLFNLSQFLDMDYDAERPALP